MSAWAGIHYFASRHGFSAPGRGEAAQEPVLTWPQGNAWLTQRLSSPLQSRLQTGRTVLRIAQGKHGVEVDTWNTATQAVERWVGRQCIVALPVFVAARVLEQPPEPLQRLASQMRYAAWLVANIQLSAPLHDRPGAPPSWDNVIYEAQGLGYVDAMHQSLRSVPGATVLTYYRALGIDSAQRKSLFEQPWTHWREQVLNDLSGPHPDLPRKAQRMALTRYGHAMAVPVPGLRTALARTGLPNTQALKFAHADWAGYSVFEEAFTLGHRAGMA